MHTDVLVIGGGNAALCAALMAAEAGARVLLLEAAPRTAGISGDERATLVIATQLLRDIVQRHAETDGHALAAIAGQVLPALDALEQLPSSR